MEKINEFTKYIAPFFIAMICFFATSCENKVLKSANEREKVLEINVDTTLGDTSSVSFVLSGVEYNIHYYNKRPQFIKVRKFSPKDSTALSYERDNMGVFIAFNDSFELSGFGCKYLYENQIIKLHLDSLKKAESLDIGSGDSLKTINLK